ncbi:MAG: endonuclease III [Bacteroidetes bacterium]|nr:endonuclease III [Bacteroidota bacterium]
MSRKERFARLIEYFSEHMPQAETELMHTDPYQLIVAVILSAQCTDKRVNMITPALYQRFPDVSSLAAASHEDVFKLIKSCSYPNNKTKHLIAMAQMVVRDFNGIVPSSREDLQKLPGVGRKTANVVASVAFSKPAMAVDTHVFRVAARIGLTWKAKNPLQAELQLVQHIPERRINIAHHWLILHGRYICTARKPKCDQCGIRDYCKYFQKTVSKSSGLTGK